VVITEDDAGSCGQLHGLLNQRTIHVGGALLAGDNRDHTWGWMEEGEDGWEEFGEQGTKRKEMDYELLSEQWTFF